MFNRFFMDVEKNGVEWRFEGDCFELIINYQGQRLCCEFDDNEIEQLIDDLAAWQMRRERERARERAIVREGVFEC